MLEAWPLMRCVSFVPQSSACEHTNHIEYDPMGNITNYELNPYVCCGQCLGGAAIYMPSVAGLVCDVVAICPSSLARMGLCWGLLCVFQALLACVFQTLRCIPRPSKCD